MVTPANPKHARLANLRRRAPSQIPLGCLDRSALLRSIVRDRNLVDWQHREINDVRYPEFLLFFRDAPKLSRHHLISAQTSCTGGCRQCSTSAATILNSV
ncbi:MAG: hypothetical protein JWL97_804 [Gemmatimonadales bacterium]|jgi:hypothetical protein|nr:hypothetical protein [Gemmatimonadales bacterium]